MEKIRGIVKKVNQEPSITGIENSLKPLQEIVEGRIEMIPFPKVKNVNIILNEEGKLDGLDPSLIVREYEDILVGNLVIVGNYRGESVSLTDEQAEKCMNYLQKNQVNNMDIEEAYDFMQTKTVAKKSEMEA